MVAIQSVSCKTLIVRQKLDLEEKGERHNSNNNSIATVAITRVSQQYIDYLSTMLSKLGKMLAHDGYGSLHIYDRCCGLDRQGVRKGGD